MKDNDFDTRELLSNLDKLKAKYSFNFDEEESAPVAEDSSVEESNNEPVVSVVSVEAEEVAEDESPVSVEAPEDNIVVKKEEPVVNDMSWLIDSNEPAAEVQAEEPVAESVVQEPEIEESEPEAEVVTEPEIDVVPEREEPGVAWYLTPQEPEEDEQEESEEPEAVEESEAPEEIEEDVYTDAEEAESDEDEDEFSDLDDDDELVVIRGNAPEKEEKKEESPFFTAFIENTASDDKKVKPPKPVKSPKPAKPVKEPKEPKEKKEKKPANPKRKKLILNIFISVVLAVALWACVFVTDILLVSNWSAPVFCTESEAYEDGSKTYTGAFYQIQISVNEDGSINRVSLPWFAKGPNGDK